MLAPIRERRIEYAKDMDQVMAMLKDGSEKANRRAEATMQEVRAAMGINYFG